MNIKCKAPQRITKEGTHINVIVASNRQVNLVLVEDILKCSSEISCDASHTGKAATAAGGGVDWSVEVHNDPRGDAPVDCCQVVCDEPTHNSTSSHTKGS